MKDYEVVIPVRGKAVVTRLANNEEEAVEKAMECLKKAFKEGGGWSYVGDFIIDGTELPEVGLA